jgi:hypothetical protein
MGIKMKKIENLMGLLLMVVMAVTMVGINTPQVFSATNQFRGVNWADQRDNFQSGVIYVSGLSASDTYDSAAIVADRVVGQFMSLLGSNSVRLPINEATVSDYWGTYTGAIDKALEKGRVILCYWAVSNGKPGNMTNFWNMWTTVINCYGSNSNCYFEPINEPYGYSKTDLCNLYYEFCTKFPGVAKGRIILDGTGYAQNVPDVGSDSRLSQCLLAVHEYNFFGNNSWLTESQWQSHFQGEVGSYADRTICTEWGCPMSAGVDRGVAYEKHDYNATSGDYYLYYCRAITSQLRSWSMGSMYWPGLRDGDTYSMTTRSGSSGSNLNLTLVNQSGLDRLQYSWGDSINPSASPDVESVVKLVNRSTGMCIDGMGRTANGSDACQYSSTNSTNQQWILEAAGSYYKIKNRTTGLYLDGAGWTGNGSTVVQYSGSTSNNQQWLLETVGSYYKFKNRATGLYIDGAGATINGYELKQYGNSSSGNQQWLIQ